MLGSSSAAPPTVIVPSAPTTRPAAPALPEPIAVVVVAPGANAVSGAPASVTLAVSTSRPACPVSAQAPLGCRAIELNAEPPGPSARGAPPANAESGAPAVV